MTELLKSARIRALFAISLSVALSAPPLAVWQLNTAYAKGIEDGPIEQEAAPVEPEAEPEAELESEPEAVPEDGPGPAVVPEDVPAAGEEELVPEGEPEPEPAAPEIPAASDPEATPEAEPEVVPEAESEPELEAEPEIVPEAEPEPDEGITFTGGLYWEPETAAVTVWLQLRAFVVNDDHSSAEDPEFVTPPVEMAPGITTYTWKNLPSHNSNGSEYRYVLHQVDANGNDWVPEGYTTGMTPDGRRGIVNTLISPPTPDTPDTPDTPEQSQTITFTGRVIWIPKTSATTTWVQLRRLMHNDDYGLVEDPEFVMPPVEMAPGTTSTPSWEDLPRFDSNGWPYWYQIFQVDADGNDWVPEGFESDMGPDGRTMIVNTLISPPTPDTPDQPDTPDTPSGPDQPDTPDTPDQPDAPSVPVQPSTAAARQASAAASEQLPKTGDSVAPRIAAALSVLGPCAAAAGMAIRRRNDSM